MIQVINQVERKSQKQMSTQTEKSYSVKAVGESPRVVDFSIFKQINTVSSSENKEPRTFQDD